MASENLNRTYLSIYEEERDHWNEMAINMREKISNGEPQDPENSDASDEEEDGRIEKECVSSGSGLLQSARRNEMRENDRPITEQSDDS